MIRAASNDELRMLRRGNKAHCGDITIRWDVHGVGVRRSFAIPRTVGNAVVRNRLRRQLQHVLVDALRPANGQGSNLGLVMLISVRSPRSGGAQYGSAGFGSETLRQFKGVVQQIADSARTRPISDVEANV